MNFVLFLDPTAKNALGVSAEQLGAIVSALTVYCNLHVARQWGGEHTVRVSPDGKDVQSYEVACALVDDLPNAPGAVAYHSVDGSEVPVIYLALNECNAVTSGADSVSSALSHELAETIGDFSVNLWADDGQGNEWAHELCDAVQEWTFTIEGITVSDFVLPSFFAPGSLAPWNYGATQGGQAVAGPFATAPGGYQVKRSSGGGETQVDGVIRGARLAKKRHPTSRTYRRGARI